MSEFNSFQAKLDAWLTQFVNAPRLFRVGVSGDDMWEAYLKSFPPGTNKIFRERTEHDDTYCRHFVRNFGNVVILDSRYKLVSIWDAPGVDEPYATVCKALSAKVKASEVSSVFLTSLNKLGEKVSYEKQTNTSWSHLHVEFPRGSAHVMAEDRIPTLLGNMNTSRAMLERALTELKPEAVATVLELIEQKTLYRGETVETAVRAFQTLQQAFHTIKPNIRNSWLWMRSLSEHSSVITIRNSSIGTLLVDLSEGTPLEDAVRKYEAVVAPSNYRRPKPVFTAAMLEKAKQDVEKLGLMDSLPRRFARLEDVTVNNVLFANRDAKKRMTGGDPFGTLAEKASTGEKAMDFSKVDTVSMEDFIKNYLSSATSVEVFFANSIKGNLASILAPQHVDAKPLFKWGNNFSWAYAGNMADSMKERVKAAGGNISGVLRFSIQWNEDGKDNNDLDAHCILPGRDKISYMHKSGHLNGTASLDVDIVVPYEKVAVENIVFTSLKDMPAGEYCFGVHCFSNRGGTGGFRAEVEFDGKLYSFDYNSAMRQSEYVDVATVIKSADGTLSLVPKLSAGMRATEAWSIRSEQFHPVSVITRSPNWWDREKPVGLGHYFFMIDGCTNPETPNGFFNEYLPDELNAHRKVFEALGAQMKVSPSTDQLSGLGFSSARGDSVVCRVTGKTKRIVKIQF